MGKHTKSKASPAKERDFREVYDSLLDSVSAEDDLDLELLLGEDVPLTEEHTVPEDVLEEIPEPSAPEEDIHAPVPEEPSVSQPLPEVEIMAVPEDVPTGDQARPLRPRPQRTGEKRPAGKSASGRKKPGTAQGKSGKRPSGGKKRRKKKNKAFKKGLKVYTIVLLCVIIAICAVLWVFLARYQARADARAQEEARVLAEQAAKQAETEAVRRAPQETFEAWEATTSPDYWADLWFQKRDLELENREMVKEYMASRFASAVPYRGEEYTPAAPVYVLRDGDDTLARIYLSGGGKTWSVSQVDLLIEGNESASFTAISGSRIYCNGVELGENYITDSSSRFDYAPLSTQLINPVAMLTYSVDGLLEKPTLTADPPEGGELVQTEDGGFLLCLSEDEGKTYADRAVRFVRDYLFYYMSGGNNLGGNYYTASSHLVPGTRAANTLRETYDGVYWNTAYSNIDTSNTTAGRVVVWADNCYSVDVTYDAKCTLNGQPIDYGGSTIRVYFLNDGSGFYYISDFVV